MNVNELWVFVDQDAPGVEEGQALSPDNPITSGLREVLSLYAGAVSPKPEPTLKHTALLQTGTLSGTIPIEKVQPILRGESNLAAEADNLRPGVAIAYAIEGESAKAPSQVRQGG